MEWFIIILLIIFVMMVTLPIYDKKVTSNTTMADAYKETKDLVMLPNPNPAPLTTHITV